MMLVPHWLIALVALQRLCELAISRRNAARLLSRGGYEVGAGHYPAIVAVQAAWIAWLWATVPAGAEPAWPWLALYLILASGRAWVMLTLGPYWTTRIIHLPSAPLVRSGPYRFCSHPNYVIVAGEVATLPLAFGQWPAALIFSILNAGVLAWRIGVENTFLRMRPQGDDG
jgi:methyltransferase